MPYQPTISFPELKTNLIKQFESTNCLRNLNLKSVKQSQTSDQMHYALHDLAYDAITKNYHNFANSTALTKCEKLKKSTLAVEHIFQNFMKKMSQICISFGKIVTKEDTEPEVLKIKKELMENYGVENLYLDNEKIVAQNVLKAAKLLEKFNIPLPKNIICSKYFQSNLAFPRQNTIIIDSKMNDIGFNFSSSTDHPAHVIVHESVHCMQPPLLGFMVKNIPAKYKDTIADLSLYAQGNFTNEVHAELLTKKIIDGLNSEEEELLQFLKGPCYI